MQGKRRTQRTALKRLKHRVNPNQGHRKSSIWYRPRRLPPPSTAPLFRKRNSKPSPHMRDSGTIPLSSIFSCTLRTHVRQSPAQALSIPSAFRLCSFCFWMNGCRNPLVIPSSMRSIPPSRHSVQKGRFLTINVHLSRIHSPHERTTVTAVSPSDSWTPRAVINQLLSRQIACDLCNRVFDDKCQYRHHLIPG